MSELTIKLENLQATLTDPVSDEDIRAAWSMVDEILGEVRQLEEELRIEKRKHIDTSNWAEEQQDRADKAEAENERLWDFHALALRYWMAADRPSDKEMYNAIAALETYRLEDISVASRDGAEE